MVPYQSVTAGGPFPPYYGSGCSDTCKIPCADRNKRGHDSALFGKLKIIDIWNEK